MLCLLHCFACHTVVTWSLNCCCHSLYHGSGKSHEQMPNHDFGSCDVYRVEAVLNLVLQLLGAHLQIDNPTPHAWWRTIMGLLFVQQLNHIHNKCAYCHVTHLLQESLRNSAFICRSTGIVISLTSPFRPNPFCRLSTITAGVLVLQVSESLNCRKRCCECGRSFPLKLHWQPLQQQHKRPSNKHWRQRSLIRPPWHH